ncbi:hypothetical protein, partial [Shewanella sp.]|uniref:hypothetical protein n=1 Tax=Shewanella sp. TaxID=50422 RepID=UPI000E929FE1
MSFNRAISIQLIDRTRATYNFDNLMSLIDFIAHEINFWSKTRDDGASHSSFISVINNLCTINAVITNKDNVAAWTDAELNERIRAVIGQNRTALEQYWLYSLHTYSQRIVSILIEHNEQTANGFLAYLTGSTLGNIQVKDMFEGSLLAYEYQYQNSDLVKRRGTERATITRLRDQLLEKNNQLIAQF